MATTTTAWILVILLFISHHGTMADETFIVSTCAKTPSPKTCVPILESDSRSYNATTLEELTDISIDISLASINVALQHAVALSIEYRGKPEYGPLLRCINYDYGNAVLALREAVKNAANKQYSQAEMSVQNAQNLTATCEKEFVSQSIKSLLTDTNLMLEDRCALSAYLAYELTS
ncbi:hypothetical protein LUZ61_016470 [Rhynchospora tenuis]|uniref:Pectinesterase inhibitor domain-containing protein n=1 Tax=Rhynchospora tenuis TaxID=198213 RepID=A0AAD5Z5K5_9POAL|nr:hypothetical protein LUZ61_016470 [Rhynchospora tenuis]